MASRSRLIRFPLRAVSSTLDRLPREFCYRVGPGGQKPRLLPTTRAAAKWGGKGSRPHFREVHGSRRAAREARRAGAHEREVTVVYHSSGRLEIWRWNQRTRAPFAQRLRLQP